MEDDRLYWRRSDKGTGARMGSMFLGGSGLGRMQNGRTGGMEDNEGAEK